MNWHVLKVCRCRRRRRRINFATAIILVTVCQRVRNGEMFYRVIIVTAHEDGILGAREREREEWQEEGEAGSTGMLLAEFSPRENSPDR